jgi:hypothetical protein
MQVFSKVPQWGLHPDAQRRHAGAVTGSYTHADPARSQLVYHLRLLRHDQGMAGKCGDDGRSHLYAAGFLRHRCEHGEAVDPRAAGGQPRAADSVRFGLLDGRVDILRFCAAYRNAD